MAIPARTRTYSYGVNQTFRSTGVALSDAQRLMRALKNSLKTLGSGAWTVVKSSDGTTVDTSDLWDADAKLIWGTGSHSWIVLRQIGMATNFELCIDLNSATTTNATLAVSFAAGFVTGGTASARPTASDEKVLISAAAWHSIPASTNHQLHVMVGHDGKVTRFFFTAANALRGYADFSVAKGTITQWANPSVAFWTSTLPSTTNLWAAANVFGIHAGVILSLYVGNHVYGSVPFNSADVAYRAGGRLNSVSNDYPFFEPTLICATSGYRGRWGKLEDVYWAPQAGPPLSTMYPVATKIWVQVGGLIVPWTGDPLTTVM